MEYRDTPETRPQATRQAGASLIEVLVSVFVLAFGILGIASMQSGALRNNQGALEQSAVVILTHSILDAMRANMSPGADGDLVVSDGYVTTGMTADGFVCDASKVTGGDAQAVNDLKRWIGDIHQSLGSSDGTCGKITCESTNPNLCTVSIQWDNSRALGGNAKQVVETRSRL